jgi:hypothetical protein
LEGVSGCAYRVTLNRYAVLRPWPGGKTCARVFTWRVGSGQESGKALDDTNRRQETPASKTVGWPYQLNGAEGRVLVSANWRHNQPIGEKALAGKTRVIEQRTERRELRARCQKPTESDNAASVTQPVKSGLTSEVEAHTE